MVRRRESRIRLGRPEHSPVSPSRTLVTCPGARVENHTATWTQTACLLPFTKVPFCVTSDRSLSPLSLTDWDFHRLLGTG